MGWDFCHAKYYKTNGSVDRKAELDERFTWGDHKVIKSSMKGSVYYGAIDFGNGNVVAVIVLTSGADRNNPYFNFGAKVMDETMHPLYYDCPKAILDLLTETDDWNANEWRDKCRQNLMADKWLSKLNIGDKIIWCNERVLTKHAPAYQFKTWFWYDEENSCYISKKRVTEMNSRPYREV